jgi:hypothetical protein
LRYDGVFVVNIRLVPRDDNRKYDAVIIRSRPARCVPPKKVLAIDSPFSGNAKKAGNFD